MGKIFFRVQKIKSYAQLARAYEHNQRYRFCQNIDKDKKSDNKELTEQNESYVKFCKQRISERVGTRKIRSDAVRAIDFCIAVGRDEISTNPFFDIDTFCNKAIEWTEETFGKENIAGMVLHLDEGAPHIHAIVVPMTADKRLSAFEYIGSPAKISKLQDTLSSKMTSLHLERGDKKSVATHTQMKTFYGAIESAYVNKLPDPTKDETVEQYANRAAIAFRTHNLQELDNQNKLKQQRDEALTKVNQLESESKEREKNIQIASERIKRSEEIIEQWESITIGLQEKDLTLNEKNELLRLLKKAKNSGDKHKEKRRTEETEKQEEK